MPIDACSSGCAPRASAAGERTALPATEQIPVGKGTGTYKANATWVDAAGNRHIAGTV